VKVSLIATVKDGGSAVAEFLDSVRRQTRRPDEVVIVDGGSTDGTLEILRAASDITVIEAPGANIAQGRNLAVRGAAHDVVAVSDADCILVPQWLERLVSTIEDGADVAMGFYRPVYNSFFETCSAAVSLPDEEEVDPRRFMPSSRSVAYRREAFDLAGGYPEWLDVGEDMYLNHRLRELDLRMDFVADAVALWRVRPTLAATWRQYYRYAWGDGVAGMHTARHAVRFSVYSAAALALFRRRPWAVGALALAAGWYASGRVRRALRLLPPGTQRWGAFVAVPALMLVADAAKMGGYVAGRLARGSVGSR
jgi:glycosyltransferase involved in cell wall biosynthesis